MNFIFDNDRPIYIQLTEQIEKCIISGKILPGEKLPSVRDFALKTKINPNTVQKSLIELEKKQLIYTERTNGKFVTTDIGLIKKYKEKYAKATAKKYFSDMNELGFNNKEAIDYLNSIGGK